MLSEIDTILFDFDGTLVEVSIDFSKMRRDILALQPKYGVTINDKLYVLEMISDAKRELQGKINRNRWFLSKMRVKFY